jgi:Flp pilus assembly pilin Flp
MQNKTRGQAVSEYLILVALIGIASIAVIQTLGHNLNARLGEVAAHLGGDHGKKITSRQVTEDMYKVRDLGDFGDAAQDNTQ